MSEILAAPTVLERVARARSRSNLGLILRDCIRDIEVHHLAYYAIPPLREADAQSWIVLTTYPDPWIRRYQAEELFRIDPIVAAARASIAPLDLRDVDTKDPRARQLLRDAKDFGIAGHGLCFPIRGHAGDFGLFTVRADVPEEEWDALKQRRLVEWMALGHAIHRRVVEIDPVQMRGGVGRLSPRERDILQMTARGFTSEEVAAECGISERVVRGYLQACRNKLNARNSTHAVARAVKLGLFEVG